MSKTKYNNSWETSFNWLSEVKEDCYQARYNICNTTFKFPIVACQMLSNTVSQQSIQKT